jgi:hypothetical protein
MLAGAEDDRTFSETEKTAAAMPLTREPMTAKGIRLRVQ